MGNSAKQHFCPGNKTPRRKQTLWYRSPMHISHKVVTGRIIFKKEKNYSPGGTKP